MELLTGVLINRLSIRWYNIIVNSQLSYNIGIIINSDHESTAIGRSFFFWEIFFFFNIM